MFGRPFCVTAKNEQEYERDEITNETERNKIQDRMRRFLRLVLAAGYFTRTAWQNYAGLSCLIFGYVVAILDMINRKRHRGQAAGACE